MMFFPHSPFYSILVITVDFLIIYALAVFGGRMEVWTSSGSARRKVR